MKSVTQPMAVFVSPRTPLTLDGPPGRQGRGARDASADWVEVSSPTADKFEADAYAQALGLKNQANTTVRLSQPLYTDLPRLGPKHAKTIESIGLDAFTLAARRVLQIPGAAMRKYYEAIDKGESLSLSEHVAKHRPPADSLEQDEPVLLGAEDLGHFFEYFFYLQQIPAAQPLGRPELLNVAARLIGGEHSTLANMRLLPDMAERCFKTLDRAVKVLPPLEFRPRSKNEAELEALWCLVGKIQACLADPDVRTLLGPPPGLVDHAKAAGLRLGGLAWGGATLAANAMVRHLQARANAGATPTA